MALPQVAVVVLLLAWGFPLHASVVVLLLTGQTVCMPRLLSDPQRFAAWYNATGTTLYVLGMLASAFAVAALAGGAA
ncbi:hypothetical protein GCM10011335_20350 [Aureimonas glaciei]|uniref:Uncharacterized protein n=1 Tax=Aureimonas glaciei TaxID=1776957 RepID=A0A916XWP5_9HYPH|nr:hypothetical protein GCM10011335_20350 [Aureimonas glaciei]